jgi:hypothetical protein
MKKVFFLPIFIVFALIAFKGKTQQVISASGGHFENENISMSWTVGEPVIETFADADFILTQGFQQPYSFFLQQILNIPIGWSGISGYIDPLNKSIEGIFSPWENDFIILASMTEMYWPETGVNTIVNWDYHTGYQIKAANAFDLEMTGTKVSDPTVEIPAGWSLLPVLVACETPVEELFAGFEELTIVKQVAGINLYWPDYNINTLGNLQPGKAYFVAASDAGQVTFPACAKSRYTPPPPVKLVNNTPWNDFIPTAASHAVAFPAEALTTSGIMPGDVIGVFTPNGRCAGQVEVHQLHSGLALVAFGNDEITPEKEGFEYSETMQFKVYRPATSEEMLLEVEYDPALPNMANFALQGMSAAKSMKLQSLGVNECADSQFNIFPNPSTGIFNLSMNVWPEMTQIQLLDPRGQTINIFRIENKPNGHSQAFDLSNLPKGVYFVKINGGGLVTVEKIVIN